MGLPPDLKPLSLDQIATNLFPAADENRKLDKALEAFKAEVERIQKIPLAGGGEMPFAGAWRMAKRTRPDLWGVLENYRQTGRVEEPRVNPIGPHKGVVEGADSLVKETGLYWARAAFNDEVARWVGTFNGVGKRDFGQAWEAAKMARPDLFREFAKFNPEPR